MDGHLLAVYPCLFKHLYFFFELMFHVFRDNFGHVFGDQCYIRREEGVLKNRRPFGQESGKYDQQN